MSRASVGPANEHLVERVVRSAYYQQHCAHVDDMLALAELAIDCESVGGFFGGRDGLARATPFACLVFRALILAAAGGVRSGDAVTGEGDSLVDFLLEYVRQPHHKYLRVFGIVCLRLLGTDRVQPLRVHRALDVGFLDYRRVRVVRPADGAVVLATVDQVCDLLLFPPAALLQAAPASAAPSPLASLLGGGGGGQQHGFLGLGLPPMPNRRQLLELHPEERHSVLHA